MTLTRAVRDNLSFKPENTRTILRRALRLWLEEPSYESDWFKAWKKCGSFLRVQRRCSARWLKKS